MSEGNRSVISEDEKDNLVTDKKNLNDFFVIDKLNKRLDKIQDFHRELKDLQSFHGQ